MRKKKRPSFKPVVLPVGGGKGGIGKSAITANLALILARLEHEVICIDADLGSSDLHNLLGLVNDLPGLGEVLATREKTVDQVVHPVLESKMAFVPGDAMMVATANPGFQQKRKLIHDIKKLPAEFVLLDLGAGASITVMDFFLSSLLSFLVMLPEKTACLNAFNFLKNAVFRSLDRLYKNNTQTKSALLNYRGRLKGPGQMELEELFLSLEKAKTGEGKKAQDLLASFRPKLVLNRVRKMDDFIFASKLEKWARQDLGLFLEVVGFLPEDDILEKASSKGIAAMDLNPRAPFCKALTLIGLEMEKWAGKADDWAQDKQFFDSFQRSATLFAPFF